MNGETQTENNKDTDKEAHTIKKQRDRDKQVYRQKDI
jgi:hypothetical protein